MTSNIKIWGVLIVVAIIAIGAYFFPQTQTLLGRVGTAFPNGLCTGAACSATSGSLTIGASGTSVSQLLKGTCNLLGMDVSQTGSTTVPYDCAVTGVVSGDIVFAALASSTASVSADSFSIVAAKASTTSGYITVLVKNFGTARAPSTLNIGSSTQYLIVR